MDTIVRPPQAPPESRVAARPRRRRPGWALAIVVTLAVTGAVVWITNVEPLGPGSFGGGAAGPRIHVTTPPDDSVDGPYVQAVDAPRGSTFIYAISIRNDGPAPVTILDIGDDSTTGSIPRRAIGVNTHPYENPGPARGYIPFAPFRLGSGQEAAVRMEANIGDDLCSQGRGYVSWSSEAVTYRILGITRHSDVETRNEIQVHVTNGGTAPGC